MKMLRSILPLLLLSVLFACSNKDEPANSIPTEEVEIGEPETAPAPVALENDTATERVEVAPGLEVKVLRTGEGTAVESGDQVEVHYTGWIFDAAAENGRGSKFDSSVERGERYQFPLGGGRVIEGWDLGVEGMLIGEVRELKIAPELAYGDTGAGSVIPPGATLIFEIERFETPAADVN